jgi:hypothetical protein
VCVCVCVDDELHLTFESLAVSLRTTRFNIKKFCMVLALRWVFLCMYLGTDSEFCSTDHNLLKTERRPLHLKTQSVPRCKHFISVIKPIGLCCKWHKSLFTKHRTYNCWMLMMFMCSVKADNALLQQLTEMSAQFPVASWVLWNKWKSERSPSLFFSFYSSFLIFSIYP